MRISTAWAQQLSVNAMGKQQTELAKVQQQLSSGLKVSTPAEDPAAAVRILDLEGTIVKTNQYQSNISTARGRLNLEESALATSDNILFRAKELTIQAMNATVSSSDRLAIKTEVDQLIEQLAGVANTKNANGEFIFSGDLATVPAFVQDTSGEYVYQGGPQQRALQIGPSRQVADGDLGFNVFENIKSSSPAADQAVDQNGNPTKIRSIFNTLKALSEGLNATFSATPGEITGDRFLRYGLDYTASTTKFDLSATAENTTPPLFPTIPPTAFALSPAPTIDLTGKQFAGVEDLVTEINTQLADAPLLATDVAPNTNIPVGSNFSAAIQARSNGNRIEFVSIGTGTGSGITITNVLGKFLTDAGFSDSSNNLTKTGVDAQVYQDQLGNVLTDLDAALGSFLQARTSVGTRLNALDNQESQNEKFVLDTKTTLSQTQDLDYAEAISRFQLQSTALQAGQQAFAQVNKLSLFNYL